MPLVVLILPKTEKSQQVFNEHELLGLSDSRLIGLYHRCQKYGHSYKLWYGHAQSYFTATL
nr:unnamed protein product [Callosobruchus chinensis]